MQRGVGLGRDIRAVPHVAKCKQGDPKRASPDTYAPELKAMQWVSSHSLLNLKTKLASLASFRPEERLQSGWRHFLGTHFDTAGLLKEAQEVQSRDELLKPVVAELDRPHEVEEESHLEESEDACDVGPASEEDEAIVGAPVVSVPYFSSGPEPPPPMPNTNVG